MISICKHGFCPLHLFFSDFPLVGGILGGIGDQEPVLHFPGAVWLFFIEKLIRILFRDRIKVCEPVVGKPSESFAVKRQFPVYHRKFFYRLCDDIRTVPGVVIEPVVF